MFWASRDKNHPFPLYRKFAVPVALCDRRRGDRAHRPHQRICPSSRRTTASPTPISKQIVRNSLEYDFLPGTSLWDGAAFQRVVSDCRGNTLGDASPSPSCAAFLKASEKARQQWELEGRFRPSRPAPIDYEIAWLWLFATATEEPTPGLKRRHDASAKHHSRGGRGLHRVPADLLDRPTSSSRADCSGSSRPNFRRASRSPSSSAPSCR